MFLLIERIKTRRGCRIDPSHLRSARFPLELDHILPRYLGGRPPSTISTGLKGRRRDWIRVWWFLFHPNIQVLCHPCHKRKDEHHAMKKAPSKEGA
jgi:5-methylcytosine-specific restriction endonuclease McrA